MLMRTNAIIGQGKIYWLCMYATNQQPLPQILSKDLSRQNKFYREAKSLSNTSLLSPFYSTFYDVLYKFFYSNAYY